MGRAKKKNRGKKGASGAEQEVSQNPPQHNPVSGNVARNGNMQPDAGNADVRNENLLAHLEMLMQTHNRETAVEGSSGDLIANNKFSNMLATMEKVDLPEELNDAFRYWLESKTMNIADNDAVIQGWKGYKPNKPDLPLVHQILREDESKIAAIEYQIFVFKSTIAESVKLFNLQIDGRKVKAKDVLQMIKDRIGFLQERRQHEEDTLDKWTMIDLENEEAVELLTDIFVKGTKEDVMDFEKNYLAGYVMEMQEKRDDPMKNNGERKDDKETQPQFSNSPDIGQNLPLPKELFDAIQFWVRIKKVTAMALTNSINGWERFEPKFKKDIAVVNEVLSTDNYKLLDFERQVFEKKKTIAEYTELLDARFELGEVNNTDVAEKVIARVKVLVEKRSHVEEALTNWKMLDLQAEGIVELLSSVFLDGTSEIMTDFEENYLSAYVSRVEGEGLDDAYEPQNDSEAEIRGNAQSSVTVENGAPPVDVTDTIPFGVGDNVVPETELLQNDVEYPINNQKKKEEEIAQKKETGVVFTSKVSYDVSFSVNKSWEVEIDEVELEESDQSGDEEEEGRRRSSNIRITKSATIMLNSSDNLLGAPKPVLKGAGSENVEQFDSGNEHAVNGSTKARTPQLHDFQEGIVVSVLSLPDSEDVLQNDSEDTNDIADPITSEEEGRDTARESGNRIVPLDDDVAAVQSPDIDPNENSSQDHHEEINRIDTTHIQGSSSSREASTPNHDRGITTGVLLPYPPGVLEPVNMPNIDQKSHLPKELHDIIMVWLETNVVAISDLEETLEGWQGFKPNDDVESSMVNQILNLDNETIMKFEDQFFTEKKTIAEIFKELKLPLDNEKIDVKDVEKNVLSRMEQLQSKKQFLDEMLDRFSTFNLQDDRIIQQLIEVFQSGSEESILEFERLVWSNGGTNPVIAQDKASQGNDGPSVDFAADAIRSAQQRMSTQQGRKKKGSKSKKKKGNQKSSGSASQSSKSKNQKPDPKPNSLKACEDASGEIPKEQGASSSTGAVPKRTWKTSPFLSLEAIRLEVSGNQDSDWAELRDNSVNKYEKCVEEFANSFDVFERANSKFSLKAGQQIAVRYLDKMIMGTGKTAEQVANFDIDCELHNMQLHYNWGVKIQEDELEKCKELMREDMRQRSNVFRSLRDNIGKLPPRTVMKICFLDSVPLDEKYMMLEHGFVKQHLMAKIKRQMGIRECLIGMSVGLPSVVNSV